MTNKSTKTITIKKTAAKKVSARRTSLTNKPTLTKVPILDPRVFNYKASEALLSQVIHVYRDNTHQNTSKVKTRGELTKTTKKMYKQKGTGNARHGSKMAPIFVGGGVAFGPTGVKPGNLKINRKMRTAALAGILSLYAKDNAVELVAAPELLKPEVKSVKPLLAKPDTLLVYAKETPAFVSSVKNLRNVNLVEADKLNAYLIASYKYIALTPSAHEAIVARILPLLKSPKLDQLAK